MTSRQVIAQILAAHPQLSEFGYGVYAQYAQTGNALEQIAGELTKQRASMVQPAALEQFHCARVWLRQFDKTARPNPRGTSYGLSRVAQRVIGPVRHGLFIAAALAEGFSVVRANPGSPNALLNISSHAWRHSFGLGRLGARAADQADPGLAGRGG